MRESSSMAWFWCSVLALGLLATAGGSRPSAWGLAGMGAAGRAIAFLQKSRSWREHGRDP